MNDQEMTAAAVEGKSLVLPQASESLTMSSREIADLCEKRHDHVMRDIKKMLDDLGLPAPKFGGTSTVQQPNGGEREVPCYNLPKDLTLTLVAGYNVVLRKRIIDRWMKLEAERQTFDPATILESPEAMRGLLLTYTERVIALEAKVDDMRPQVQALDRIANSDGSLCITDAPGARCSPPRCSRQSSASSTRMSRHRRSDSRASCS